jgi:hypothetical protein
MTDARRQALLAELNEQRAITVYALAEDYPRPFVPEDPAARRLMENGILEIVYQHPAVLAIDAQIAALFPEIDRG